MNERSITGIVRNRSTRARAARAVKLVFWYAFTLGLFAGMGVLAAWRG